MDSEELLIISDIFSSCQLFTVNCQPLSANGLRTSINEKIQRVAERQPVFVGCCPTYFGSEKELVYICRIAVPTAR